jgi:hypothetical protein
MGEMDMLYSKRITVECGMEMLRRPKQKRKSWWNHLLYLWAINHAMGGGQEVAFLQALVNSSKPSLENMLNTAYDKYRTDYEVLAMEIIDRAKDFETISKRKCYKCGRAGHISRHCKKESQNHLRHAFF